MRKKLLLLILSLTLFSSCAITLPVEERGHNVTRKKCMTSETLLSCAEELSLQSGVNQPISIEICVSICENVGE